MWIQVFTEVLWPVMLSTAVASITSIHARRASDGSSLVGAVDAFPTYPENLVEAMDDRTRLLLARGATSRRSKLIPRALVLADVIGLSVAYVLANLLWGARGLFGSSRETVLFVLSLPCWIFVANLHGLYHRDEERADHSTTDDIVGVFHLVTIGAWLLLVASRVLDMRGPSAFRLATFWLLAVGLVPLTRTIARHLCTRSRAFEQNTVIVGAGDVGQLICRKLMRHREYGANVVGFVDREPKVRRADLPELLSILGGPERLPEIIRTLEVERVIIAFSNESTSDLLALLRQMRPLGVQIDLVPWLFELIGPRISVHAVEGLPLLGLPPTRRSAAARAVKRLIDVVVSAIALVMLSPLMAFIAWRIRRDSPGPILFRQRRLGLGMKQFTALKFRTMKVDTDSAAHEEFIRKTLTGVEAQKSGLYKLDQADAVTRAGRWLRKTSLDELPQLINVLRGEMSLVGPRPCIPYEAENFARHHLERFAMPQGITGLWQVTARANATYLEALDLDVAYVRDWSLWLDLQLILRTPLQLIRQRSATL
jgi:exopolysaccharide biosynthesis polyprenyl glycosylphosphotransferase